VRKTIRNLLAEYGAVAVVVYFAIFFAVLFAFWGAIRLGWHPASVTGNVGAFTAAYLATKVTQPLRNAATLALTPLAARGYEWMARSLRRGPTERAARTPRAEQPSSESSAD
jgi:hypothetical protein